MKMTKHLGVKDEDAHDYAHNLRFNETILTSYDPDLRAIFRTCAP